MGRLKLKDVQQYVEQNIGVFHEKRILSLDRLKLTDVLKRKNPYLYKAKNVLTSEQIVKGLVDAHLSSQEEAMFGDWLEGLAIFINGKVYGGKKSSSPGIDLEFEKDNSRYIVSIKSGPNWGNSSQIKKMITDFNAATKSLRTSNSKINVVSVNGCCYGRDKHPIKGNYFKYCGENFWEFISGSRALYIEIIEPLGYKAKEKNEEFNQSYARVVNKFTKIFANEYCKTNGEIDWEKLVKYNSASEY
jgi:hypothetical protein